MTSPKIYPSHEPIDNDINLPLNSDDSTEKKVQNALEIEAKTNLENSNQNEENLKFSPVKLKDSANSTLSTSVNLDQDTAILSTEKKSDQELLNSEIDKLKAANQQWQSKFQALRIFCLILVLLIGLALGLGSALNWNFSQTSLLEKQTRNLIETEFLFDKPNEMKLAGGKLKGLVNSLEDPYSEFLSPEDAKKAENRLNNRYVGIGIQFDFKSSVRVQKILKNSPASRSNLQVGDELVSVDGVKISDIKLAEIADKIRGEAGTVVNLEVRRPELISSNSNPSSTTNSSQNNSSSTSLLPAQTLTVSIKREPIIGELAELEVRGNVGIITISSFGDQLDQKMQELAGQITQNSQIKSLIIDLRGNGGGLLDQAIEVSSYFLTPNSLVVQEKSKDQTQKLFSTAKNPSLAQYPVKVLIDGNSASASEIMAATLRDNRQVPLVGQKSFGKGIVQRVFELNGGNKLKLTIEEWLTPNNTQIHKVGLTPDVVVPEKEDSLEFALKN